MSDDVLKHFEEQQTPSDPPKSAGKSVTLTITLHPNQQIDFQFPLQNKILAYGLLEVARAQLDKLYLVNEAKAQATTTPGGVAGLLRRMNGG